MIRPAALVLLAALLPAGFAAAQNCQPTIRKTTTFNGGWWCPTHTYCYEVCNPGNCPFPIESVTIDFACGAGQIDLSTMTGPDSWGATVVGGGTQIRFSTGRRTAQIHSGTCATLCVTTICHPRCIEGVQTANFFTELGLPIGQSRNRAVALDGGPRTPPAGEPIAFTGTQYCLQVTDASAPFGQDIVLASPFLVPQGIFVQGFGMLHLDPLLILPLAPVPLNGMGMGQMQLPIPPDPALAGATLAFQSLTIDPSFPRLSNGLVIEIR